MSVNSIGTSNENVSQTAQPDTKKLIRHLKKRMLLKSKDKLSLQRKSILLNN